MSQELDGGLGAGVGAGASAGSSVGAGVGVGVGGGLLGQQSWVTDLEGLPVAVIELTVDGRAQNANRAFEALTGMERLDWSGRGWLVLLASDQRAALFAALKAHRDFDLNLRMLRLDESQRWVRFMGRWIPERGMALCVVHDATATELAMQDAQVELHRLRMLADAVPVAIAYFEGEDHVCAYANQQYARTFGLDSTSIKGRTLRQIIGDASAVSIQSQVDTVLRECRTVSYVRHVTSPTGAMVWMDVSLVPHQLANGRLVGVFVLISDITRHRMAEIAVRESEERLSKFMDATIEGIAFHKDGFITDANAPMGELVGLTPEQLRGRYVLDFVAPEHLPRARKGMVEGLEQQYEAALVGRDGQPVAVEVIVRRTRRAGEDTRMVVVRDVRDRHAARARIRHLALHDALTGLHNRGAFMEALELALADHAARGDVLALMFMDLDHFKRVNDHHGHLAGDALLRAVAERIKNWLPEGAVAGRFGGDEFVILLPHAGSRDVVWARAERLRVAMAAPVQHEGQNLAVTPTIGMALYPDHGQGPDELLRHADTALYVGKAQGRDGIAFFEPGVGATAVDTAKLLERQLAQAVAAGEFELVWQPRIRAVDSAVEAMHVSVRWNHPQRGSLSAETFAGAVEQRHPLRPLADWMTQQALCMWQAWQGGVLGGDVALALDLGILHPHGLAMSATVSQALEQRTAPSGPWWVETDEHALRESAGTVPSWMHQLQSVGAGVVLEDFGATGLSLARMRSLPLRGVKLDRHLVAQLPDDGAAASAAAAMIGLARGLGFSVCATGVDTQAQYHWLAAHGCEHLQGQWIHAPMTSAQAGQWLAQRVPSVKPR